MTRKEQLELEIAYESRLFFILLAAAIAVIAWLFTNVQKTDPPLLYIAGGGEVLLVAALAYLNRRIKNKMEEVGTL